MVNDLNCLKVPELLCGLIMAARLLEKAEKLELDTLANLELRSGQVQASLQGERALLNERVVKGHIQKRGFCKWYLRCSRRRY